jgi:hypothetical protein
MAIVCAWTGHAAIGRTGRLVNADAPPWPVSHDWANYPLIILVKSIRMVPLFKRPLSEKKSK